MKPKPVVIRSALRTVALMEHVADSPAGETTISQASAALALPPSTVHHLVRTLVGAGYLQQDPVSRRYRLGPRAIALSAAILGRVDVLREAQRVMRGCAVAIDEAISLSVLDGGQVASVHRVEPGGLAGYPFGGVRRASVHCAAPGKLLVSAWSDEQVADFFAQQGMPAATARSLTDPAAFMHELAKVRRQGYALDDEETMTGLRCVAAPIRDHSGGVVAAFSAGGPCARFQGDRLEHVASVLMDAAADVSRRLGAPVATARPA